VVEDGALSGYNTDAGAFIRPLETKVSNLSRARVAVLGAGGAASAALWSLRQVGASVTLFARDGAKGRALAEKFDAGWKDLFDASFAGYDAVVNATPVGTARHFDEQTLATAEQLRGARLAYDLVYNPTDTRFLREARAAGCETLGGLAMLVAQAVDQFELWTGETAPEDVMYEAARKALAQ
jgi:shikimate dehydrogenase